MTVNKAFKKQVRARMERTGETYMQAREAILKGVAETSKPQANQSDEAAT